MEVDEELARLQSIYLSNTPHYLSILSPAVVETSAEAVCVQEDEQKLDKEKKTYRARKNVIWEAMLGS